MKVRSNPERKLEDNPIQVRDPIDNKPLPEEGKAVPENAYWLRRLRDGDVIEVPESN